MADAFYHRQQAHICRALASGCFHQPTGDVLRELAVEHEAKADKIEADTAKLARSAQSRSGEEGLGDELDSDPEQSS